MSASSAVDYGALNISDVTSDDVNAKILRRLRDNDEHTLFDTLFVRDRPGAFGRAGNAYIIEDARSMGVLGHCLGRCTKVRELCLEGLGEFDVDVFGPLLRGLQNNQSIRKVFIFGGLHIPCGFSQMLAPFIRDSPSLDTFEVSGVQMDVEQYRSLSLALKAGNSLKRYCISGLSDGDRYDHEETIIDNIEALKMHPQLEELTYRRFSLGRNTCTALAGLLRQSAGMRRLTLSNNVIGDSGLEALVDALAHCGALRHLDLSRSPSIAVRGWRAVAALLEDPNSTLQQLNLRENGINDESATIIANALAPNSRLEQLYLDSNPNITSKGWVAFSTVLCDATSANSTFLSNHTLQCLESRRRWSLPLPRNLEISLRLNHDSVKKRVALTKILNHQDDIDMQPLFEWDLKVLPSVIQWCERAAYYWIESQECNRKRKLEAIYQFIRGMPNLTIHSILGLNTTSAQTRGMKRRHSLLWTP
ncbi:hypothetical protein ACHAXT_001829 [Thalassiosira profunda]